MAQKRDYATKKKGKTEVYPFWNLEDIKNVVEWIELHDWKRIPGATYTRNATSSEIDYINKMLNR